MADKTKKVAVAVIHGMGDQKADFAKPFINAIQARCKGVCGDDIVIEPVYWANKMRDDENRLFKRMSAGGPLRYIFARRLMINYVADALAYQPTNHDRNAYDDIHTSFARALANLAHDAGGTAPLCIVAHSLGSVIASNYIYDLQKPELIPHHLKKEMHDTALEKGETLNLLYTLGSPLALWSLRFSNFGHPISIPVPQLEKHHPHLKSAWINYYDRDDAIGFPLRELNESYKEVVSADIEVNVGNICTRWNPLSHTAYLESQNVIKPIAESLINTWRAINTQSPDK